MAWTTKAVFLRADQVLADVIAQIKTDQWNIMIPEWFQVGPTQKAANLKQIINYHAYDEAWVPETLAGKTIEEVGAAYDGDLLGNDPKDNYKKYFKRAQEYIRSSGYDPDRVVHLTYGDFPAHEYLRHVASFRGFRAYDIAKLIGAPTKLPDDLVEGMWEILSPDMEEWRKIGVYPAAVPVPEDATLQAKLIGLSGREP